MINRAVTLLLFTLVTLSCQDDNVDSIFVSVGSEHSGITFANTLTDSPDFNIIEYLYYYNGGGVAAGDLNNDGLVDLYFAGNQVDDVLYINQGDLQFEDQSAVSGIAMHSGWSTGVTLVDINADGWLDIYVCRLGDYKIYKDHNHLFINNQDGTFTESAAAYGLDFSGFGTQACFFDYDRDGDLDCYLLNHSVKRPDQFVNADKIRNISDSLAGDRLMRNDSLHFVDVSEASGIKASAVGFGLGVASADINNDGWQDIYIGNDFHENDYLYINNKDGTFTDIVRSSMDHTSNFTMGTTIADVNADGLLDIFTLDMQPDDETIFKSSGGWENMQIYDFKRSFGYHHQSPRNALQVNLGNHQERPVFSEQAAMNNLHATDWSWSPLIADYDLDGDNDIFITNGIRRRPNDMDFVNYMSDNITGESTDAQMISQMGTGSVPNVIYLNEGDEYTKAQLGEAIISNGACMADLDNDGDLDVVTNNIDHAASVWGNQTDPEQYVKVRLRSDDDNINALGAKISSVSNGQSAKKVTSQLISSSSGFLSMNEAVAIFPTRDQSIELIVDWPDGTVSKETVLATDGEVVISYERNNTQVERKDHSEQRFEMTPYDHADQPYNDQNTETLIPYLQSNLSPKMAVNKDGHVFVTQGKGRSGYVLGDRGSRVVSKIDKQSDVMRVDETDATYFDVDGDGDEDLYVALGGMELDNGDLSLVDRLYLYEDGKYSNAKGWLPLIGKNSSTVTPCDYDLDGDMDLFVGVQGVANQYGQSESSYLLENIDNTKLEPRSIDLRGMVYDAEWSDLDGDGRKDLVVVGHWMPITILYARKNGFVKEEIPNSSGLWFSVTLTDADGDGAIDIIAGNYGENHRIQVSQDSPMRLYRADFDHNRSFDPILTYESDGIEYPYANLDLMLKQLPLKKKNFQRHSIYANTSIGGIFTKSELTDAEVKEVQTLASYIYYRQDEKWEGRTLPASLQLAPLWTISEWNGGYVAAGNLYDVDPNWGRQDALPVTNFGVTRARKVKIYDFPILKSEVRSAVGVDSVLLIACRNSAIQRLYNEVQK